jgi:molecular chaperone GrpE
LEIKKFHRIGKIKDKFKFKFSANGEKKMEQTDSSSTNTQDLNSEKILEEKVENSSSNNKKILENSSTESQDGTAEHVSSPLDFQECNADTIAANQDDKLSSDIEHDQKPSILVPVEEYNELLSFKKEAEDYKEKYVRLLAEFENFKKRTIKERQDLIKYQGERIFSDLLDVVDNFDFAIAHIDSSPDQLKPGIIMIHKMLKDFLSKWEVKDEPGIGKLFDPLKHNAISQEPSIEGEPGTILKEFKKTYFYKDKLLRTGEVIVAVAEEEPQS